VRRRPPWDGITEWELIKYRPTPFPADAVLGDVMDSDPPVVAPGTHQERAAWLASQRSEPGLAVVDEHGHFRGLIPSPLAGWHPAQGA
jgi:hypothetical protein